MGLVVKFSIQKTTPQYLHNEGLVSTNIIKFIIEFQLHRQHLVLYLHT